MPDKIAIVGVACRFPGGIADLDGLWTLLSDGREAVGAPPADRFDVERFWDANQMRPGKSYTFAGGYLDDIAGFDADFFGISPREALSIDPQQRLLLELGIEALDDAGIDPNSLRGSDSAVFVGASVMDYAGQQMVTPEAIGPYTNSGSALSNTANRRPEDDPEWVYWFSADEIDVMAGRCWAERHQPTRAIPRLERALATYDDRFTREVLCTCPGSPRRACSPVRSNTPPSWRSGHWRLRAARHPRAATDVCASSPNGSRRTATFPRYAS